MSTPGKCFQKRHGCPRRVYADSGTLGWKALLSASWSQFSHLEDKVGLLVSPVELTAVLMPSWLPHAQIERN